MRRKIHPCVVHHEGNDYYDNLDADEAGKAYKRKEVREARDYWWRNYNTNLISSFLDEFSQYEGLLDFENPIEENENLYAIWKE